MPWYGGHAAAAAPPSPAALPDAPSFPPPLLCSLQARQLSAAALPAAETMDPAVENVVERIHSSTARIVLYLGGGASQVGCLPRLPAASGVQTAASGAWPGPPAWLNAAAGLSQNLRGPEQQLVRSQSIVLPDVPERQTPALHRPWAAAGRGVAAVCAGCVPHGTGHAHPLQPRQPDGCAWRAAAGLRLPRQARPRLQRMLQCMLLCSCSWQEQHSVLPWCCHTALGPHHLHAAACTLPCVGMFCRFMRPQPSGDWCLLEACRCGAATPCPPPSPQRRHRPWRGPPTARPPSCRLSAPTSSASAAPARWPQTARSGGSTRLTSPPTTAARSAGGQGVLAARALLATAGMVLWAGGCRRGRAAAAA